MQIRETFSLQLSIKRDQNSLYLHLVKGSKIHIMSNYFEYLPFKISCKSSSSFMSNSVNNKCILVIHS